MCIRDRYCSATLCQGASKRASQARWLAKPENRGYFMGAQAVARVQVWRAAHPGYSRRGPTGEQPPPSSEALQEVLPAQPSESSMISCNAPEPVTAPLQDVLSRQPTVIIGLIAHLWDSPLQEDIAAILHRLLQLGEDIEGGRHEHSQTLAGSGTSAGVAGAFQLARPPAGAGASHRAG